MEDRERSMHSALRIRIRNTADIRKLASQKTMNGTLKILSENRSHPKILHQVALCFKIEDKNASQKKQDNSQKLHYLKY